MIASRGILTALFIGVAAVSAGCSTVSGTVDRLNPFKEKEVKDEAADGRRISVIAFDEKVTAAEGLQGVDFFLPAAVGQPDWTLPGGPTEVVVEHVEAAPAFEIAWRKGFGKASNVKVHVTAPPILADGRVYVMDAEADVVAMDARTGAQIWKRRLKADNRRDKVGFGGGIAYSNGKIYVSSGFRFVAQLDAATGEVGWRQDVSSPIHGAPTISAGKVYAISTDNELLTFDAATGAPAWNFQALVEPARILSASSPAISGDVVVAAFASGELVALRAGNGNDLWNNALSRASRTNALSEIRDVAGRPVIFKGDVFAASHSGVFAAIDLRSGQPRWSLPVSSIATPWPAGDVVYIISRAGELVCASRETGQVYWIKDLNEGIKKTKDKSLFFGPVLASDKLVVVSSDGRALSINPKTGETTKTLKIGGPALITPVAAGGMVYVVTDKAELVAIR
ncbi:PQQ-binding-like beta-propeller repeat protein [Caulobacter sp. SLTY]|uniref:PQQ-like beta-propeller repeat protein n=1 Tax=Caulobacter sp. SLTY TaxID=2683262 RepID=UPI001411BEC4|nr:PQQ-like beta-propeller repeat protein [Caulobacter sp. SLTY]NBB17162.1 PQQ-binding-like beta-propeller repeat protein [Caulobacter sp. SLTY]